MNKTRQVVMLPTEKATDILLEHWKGGELYYKPKFRGDCIKHHLYILSDEEIKDGDKYVRHIHRKHISHELEIFTWEEETDKLDKTCKKIIATTDSSLHCKQKDVCSNSLSGKCICPDKLPPISESFIKAYIKAYNEGNPITEVQVEYEEYVDTEYIDGIDIHPNKHKLKLKEDGSIIIHRDKTYTRGKVIKLCQEVYRAGLKNATCSDDKIIDVDKLIEENL